MRHESGRVEEPRATARNAPPGPSYTWVRHTLLAALALFLLSGCGGRLHKQQSYVFGTLVEITIYGESEDHARQATDRVLREFDRLFIRYLFRGFYTNIRSEKYK